MTKFLKLFVPVLLLTTLIGLYFFWQKPLSPSSPESQPLIAMTQIIEHHTLDTVRAGLIAELAESGYTEATAKIIYENAHGNVSTATQIGTKFAALKPTIMVALSTQSAQILSPLAQSSQTPLIFTAVTNPLAAKLVPSKTQAAPFITGVSDFMEPAPQLEMMKTVLPHMTRLGVLHNPAEVNSVSFLKEMEAVAKTKGITLVYAGVNNTAEATNAATSLVGRVDAIYFPNDNTTMAAAGSIALVGIKNKIPTFANDSASVEHGILAGVAYDRFAMGRQTGKIVVAVLKGKNPQDIPVVYDTPFEVVINERTQKALNLKLPETLKSIRLIQEK